MKNPSKIAVLCALLASAPALLLADADADRKIEQVAASSYTFRTVLQNRVKIEARDGVATLTGVVSDDDQRNLAEDTARAVPGVAKVDNEVTVQADSSRPERSDGWIAFKIGTALLVHANVSASQTRVDVRDGAVTLTGTADSVAQKELTEEYAKDVQGVKSVKNELVVREQPAREAGAANSAIDDASITAQVKYELLANPGTSALHTKVETRDGLVLVSGAAANDAERDLVTKLAQRVRGVKSVDNQMTVGR